MERLERGFEDVIGKTDAQFRDEDVCQVLVASWRCCVLKTISLLSCREDMTS